jgi:hypothetical protein
MTCGDALLKQEHHGEGRGRVVDRTVQSVETHDKCKTGASAANLRVAIVDV